MISHTHTDSEAVDHTNFQLQIFMLPVKKLKADNRRPDGLHRELYSLLGSAVPPLAVVPGKAQAKPNWRQRVRPWAKTEFAPGREDGLKFKHWAPAQVADDTRPIQIPTFNQFNIKTDVPEWRDDSYHLFKRDDWTVEETEYLFDLCRLFDLHWMAVIDRYVWDRKTNTNTLNDSEKDDLKPRTLEELKERYYEVCSALLRAKDHLTPADEELLEQMRFPREREVQRKAHLERLLSRTPAEVAEEEALVLEARRIESVSEKLLNDRQELLGLLDSYTSDGSIAQYQSSQGIAMLHQKLLQEKSRKVPPSQLDPAGHAAATKAAHNGTGAPTAVNATNAATKAESAKASFLAQTIQRKLSAKEQQAYGISYTDKHTQGVALRSAKLPSLKASVASRVNSLLEEMGLPARPVMVTARTAAKYEQIQQEASLLLETKRLLDRLEAETTVQQAANLGGISTAPSSDSKVPDQDQAVKHEVSEVSGTIKASEASGTIEASEVSEANAAAPKPVNDADPSKDDAPAGDHSSEAKPDESDDAMVIDG